MALAPALLYSWWSRTVVRSLDDPLVPERLLALSRRSGFATGVSIAVLVGASASIWWLFWSLPLLFLGRVVAAYPVRRALYGETWSLPTYVAFTLRAIAATAGFWTGLTLLPVFARLAGRWDWLAGLAIGAVLALWYARFAQVMRRLLSVRPIEDGPLRSRFVSLAQAATARAPRFERVDLRGGAVVNAFALPSLTQPGVLFTDTLLSRLEPDEVVGICAHEIAHLEHYDPPRLRRLAMWNCAFVAAGVAVAPAVRITGLPAAVVMALWVIALASFVIVQARQRQKNETDSDRRAIELTGDPEALVRGLVKGYTFNRFPRRLAARLERQATHPSLARRIRDIRSAAGHQPSALGALVTVTTANGGTLTLDDERLQWTGSDGATHSIPYGHLVELHLTTRPAGRSQLIVVQASGKRRKFAIPDIELGRLQAVLDAVDGRLADSPALRVWTGPIRIPAIVASLLALLSGHIALTLVGLLAVLQPVAPLLGAAGLAAAATAAVIARDGGPGGDTAALVAIVLTAAAAALLGLATITRRVREGASGVKDLQALSALGLLAVPLVAVIFLDGADPIRLHQNTLRLPGAGVLLASITGLLAFSKIPWRPVAVPLAGTATLIALATGTNAFLEHFGRDPFLAPASAFEPRTVLGAPLLEFTVPFAASELRISPGGRYIAVASYDDSDEGDEATFHIGAPGGQLTPVKARDIAFLDGDRLLVMLTSGDRVALQEFTIPGAPASVWRHEIPEAFASGFVAASRGDWAVIGTDPGQRIKRVEGSVGGADPAETIWKVQREYSYPEAIGASGKEALIVDVEYELDWLDRHLPTTLRLLSRQLGAGDSVVRWWRPEAAEGTDLGRSRLEVECSALDSYAELLCTAFDGKRTRVAALGSATGATRPIGWLPGRFTRYGRAGRGWVAGYSGSTAVVIDIGTLRAYRFGGEYRYSSGITATDWTIGGLWVHGDSSVVRLFRVDATSTAAR